MAHIHIFSQLTLECACQAVRPHFVIKTLKASQPRFSVSQKEHKVLSLFLHREVIVENYIMLRAEFLNG